jgi:hypothetical protein
VDEEAGSFGQDGSGTSGGGRGGGNRMKKFFKWIFEYRISLASAHLLFFGGWVVLKIRSRTQAEFELKQERVIMKLVQNENGQSRIADVASDFDIHWDMDYMMHSKDSRIIVKPKFMDGI